MMRLITGLLLAAALSACVRGTGIKQAAQNIRERAVAAAATAEEKRLGDASSVTNPSVAQAIPDDADRSPAPAAPIQGQGVSLNPDAPDGQAAGRPANSLYGPLPYEVQSPAPAQAPAPSGDAVGP